MKLIKLNSCLDFSGHYIIRIYVGFDILLTDSTKISTIGLNLTITKNKEYYKTNKIKDPYRDIKNSNQTTQNFTIETLQEIISSKENLIHVLLKECVIKREIQNREINLPYKKTPTGFTFIYPKKDKDKYILYKIKLLEKKMIFEDVTENEERVCDEILLASSSYDIVEIIIFDSNDNIGFILKTNSFTLPRFEQINDLLNKYEVPLYMNSNEVLHIWDSVYCGNEEPKKEELKKQLFSIRDVHSGKIDILKLNISKVQKFKNLLSKNVGKNVTFNLRRKEHKYLIDSLIGIRYIEHDEYARYIVGSEKNLDKTIAKASVIRELHYYKNKIPIEDILGMLSEYFVKNGSFTVLPYPMKYLREYYNL